MATFDGIAFAPQVFCDFGADFTVVDATGENPVTAMIAGITKEAQSVVTCLDETRHGLEDGDYVTFSEVQGFGQLNGCEPRRIKVLGSVPLSLCLFSLKFNELAELEAFFAKYGRESKCWFSFSLLALSLASTLINVMYLTGKRFLLCHYLQSVGSSLKGMSLGYSSLFGYLKFWISAMDSD